MKRPILIVLAFLLLAAGGYFGYRTYKQAADRELARRRAEAQFALIKEHEAELARRTAAIAEARRMAEARAKEELARQEKLRAEQEAAQAALAAAQAEMARLAAEAERIKAAKEAAEAETAAQTAERARAAAAADAARLAALKKLREIEEARAEASRDLARLNALLRQQELEAEAQRLALEREKHDFEVGGYLVKDFSSIYIIKTEKPDPAPIEKPKSTPEN
ncbi:MAG: hypothetical protein JSR48_03985 [Verrucomicrobia bacterium]|nr:hypothetical protein [Verrucomicrobiota bacterium]